MTNDMSGLLNHVKRNETESRTIAVVSGKGGVGKTATTANLALALKEMGEKVVAVDCDQAASNLSLHLGMQLQQDRTLQDALEEENNVLDAITLHRTGLMVMPSSHMAQEEEIQQDQLERIIDRIDGTILIDAPPGLSDNVHTILDVADEVLIVTNPEIPAISDAVKVAEVLREKRDSVEDCWSIVTGVGEIHDQVLPHEIEAALEMPLASVIPYDRAVKEAVQAQTPVIHHRPHAKAAVKYRELASWLAGVEYEEPAHFSLKRFLDDVKRVVT